MSLQESREHLCPICWEMHDATHKHEVIASCADERALIDALVRLGVRWNAHVDPDNRRERAYELLRMLDNAADAGLDCSEIAGQWVVTSRRQPSDNIAA